MDSLIKKNLGFSIIEVIVSFSIIVIGLIGVLSLVNQNIQVQYTNKNNLIGLTILIPGVLKI